MTVFGRFLRRRPRPDATSPIDPWPDFSARLVLRSAATKLDALAVIALAVDAPVEHQRTLRPRVPWRDGTWVEVETPRHGEPPPLAIDVHSGVSEEHARVHAFALLEVLQASTAWNLRADAAR